MPKLADKTNAELRDECVQHWERARDLTVEQIFAGEESITGGNCAFCNVYIKGKGYDDRCIGCPIFLKTGWKSCFYTPYHGASDSREYVTEIDDRSGEVLRDAISEYKSSCQDMIDFLENLEV